LYISLQYRSINKVGHQTMDIQGERWNKKLTLNLN